MTLKLFNTLTREKETFEPMDEGRVRLYSCGQTIYDNLHIGNARAYAVWDTLRRYLEWRGYTVRHVQNITDVGHLTDDGDQGEDKVEKRAKELGLEPMELVEDQLARYFRDTSALNIGRGFDEEVGGSTDEGEASGRQDIMPRATGHIHEMVNYVQTILDNGYAYEREGNIYFDVERFADDYDYGAMAKKDLAQLKEEAKSRVEPDPNKKNQFDFALWLNAEGTSHAMTWDATFDVDGDRVDVTGYPGWHLECTVMSQKYLGDRFDIHTGGKDHIFPHHPNERAQALAATGEGQADYWLHNEFITVQGDKMAKSEGNFHTVRELIDEHGFSGDVIRLYLISAHYRTELDFSLDDLERIGKELKRIRRTVQRIEAHASRETSVDEERRQLRERFETAMDDDLNTADAKAAVLSFVDAANTALEEGATVSDQDADLIRELMQVLGVDVDAQSQDEERLQHTVEFLIGLREDFRQQEHYEIADEVRERLDELGIALEDTDDGTVWYWA